MDEYERSRKIKGIIYELGVNRNDIEKYGFTKSEYDKAKDEVEQSKIKSIEREKIRKQQEEIKSKISTNAIQLFNQEISKKREQIMKKLQDSDKKRGVNSFEDWGSSSSVAMKEKRELKELIKQRKRFMEG